MLVEAALALEIHRINPSVSQQKSVVYAHWVMEEAEPRGIDPWIFHSLIYQESRWTPSVVAHEKNGSCSVGLGQINVSCNSPQVALLKQPRENLRRMGSFLGKLKTGCKERCEELGWLRGYNPGSPQYLVEIRKRVDENHARYRESTLREVPARVLLAGVHR